MRTVLLLASLLCLGPAWASSPEPMVDFRVVGGIAGVTQRLVIFEQGLARVEAGAGRTVHESFCARLEEDQMRKIRSTLEAAGFEHLQQEYVPAHPVFDGYTYSIAYRGSTVRTLDPLEDAAPPGLQAVIRLLQEVLRSVRAGAKSCGDFPLTFIPGGEAHAHIVFP